MKTAKPFFLLAAAISLGLSLTVCAQDFGPSFITNFSELKPVFKDLSNADGSYLRAKFTDYDGVAENEINIKNQTYAVVPTGGGFFQRQVIQTTIKVTPMAGSPGVFDVVTQSMAFFTPVDADDNETGPESSAGIGPTTENNVAEADLNLPKSTEFYPLNVQLSDPSSPGDP